MRPPVLRVRLLGPIDLRIGERQLPPLDSARAESLLTYLLLHRDVPQPRQRLAFLLWPDSAEGQAQTNLRKVLHNLRRALPDTDRTIEIGPRTLRWQPDAPLWLDVEQFERALAGGQFEEAVQLYAGELLEGRYDEWLTDERELGIAPSPGTRAVYESLIAARSAPTGTKVPSTSPFTGRAAEQAKLAAVWGAGPRRLR